jgi:plastocyanin
MTRKALPLALLVAIVASACSQSSGKSAPTTRATSAPVATTAQPGQQQALASVPTPTGGVVGIGIDDNLYNPAQKTLPYQPGTGINWDTRAARNQHSVTADNGAFDSSPQCPPSCLGPGQDFRIAEPLPGVYHYHCRVHGSAMTGVLIIER